MQILNQIFNPKVYIHRYALRLIRILKVLSWVLFFLNLIWKVEKDLKEYLKLIKVE